MTDATAAAGLLAAALEARAWTWAARAKDLAKVELSGLSMLICSETDPACVSTNEKSVT
jgi:hypothetical protein